MKYLALADADRVQDYVFSPPQLRYIRGASYLQSKAIEEIRDAHPGAILFANGGVVLADFSSPQGAEEFCSRANAIFGVTTGSGTVSTACVKYDEAHFLQGWKRVRDAVESAKRQRANLHGPGTHSFWVSCERCGSEPAKDLVSEPEQPGLAVCSTCRRKYDAHGRSRALSGFRHPEHFEELARLSSPSNYLALVYIDIDRLGKYLDRHVRTRDDCASLSEAIDNAVRNAVNEAGRRAAAGPGKHQTEPDIQPFMTLLAGGDDAIVMLAAHLAVPFLRYFRQEFERPHYWEGRDIPFFSVGLVYANHHLPIGAFVEAARQRYRFAKTRKDFHSVAFSLVTSSLVDDPETTPKPTNNPYDLDDFLLFGEAISRLKAMGAPRSKIHQLYEMAWKLPLPGEFEYLGLLLRLPQATRAEIRKTIGHTLWTVDSSGLPRTRAADLVELWEFVHA